MERGSIIKWLLLGLAAYLFFSVGLPKLTGSGGSSAKLQFAGLNDMTAPAADARKPEEICTLDGGRFKAELSTRGASLKHMTLSEAGGKGKPDYRDFNRADRAPIDLVTTTLEGRMPLRTDLRMLGAPDGQQVAFDDFDWKLAEHDNKSCTFTYGDDTTALTKKISLVPDDKGEPKPFALAVEVKVQNLGSTPKKHRFAIEQTSYRTKKETEGHLGRQSEFLTETTAGTNAKVERQSPSDFEPKAYDKDASRTPAEKEFNAERWRFFKGEPRFVAVSSTYFSKILIPQGTSIVGANVPGDMFASAETQIEETWDANRYGDKEKDPNFGHVYRARLAYPEIELPPQASATYRALAFAGPKERNVLADLNHGASAVLDLGTFAPIGEKLVWYVLKLRDFVGSWGLAIVLLTLSIRIVVAPLSLSQIKSSMAMRKLKPEMDAINAKYKDDAAQRGLAVQELWRKNGVTNPVLGCLPMVLQMPIWWALYRSLQTAVELYHERFLWFADLSAPDKYYIIPVVLGLSSVLQQKIMPPQGDPQQQKMMLYMMPALFTFMMLFLPAGLGVYMLTNTWLGIGQQLLVERYYKSKGVGRGGGGIEVREKPVGEGSKPTPVLGKGKARARG